MFKKLPGVDDFTESILLGMTEEVQAVCRKMESLVPGLDLKDACTVKQWYMECYDGQMSDTSSLKACMNTNKGYDGLKHPCKQVWSCNIAAAVKGRLIGS